MNLRTVSAALLAVAASILWMAPTAFATTIESTEDQAYTGTVAAESEGHVSLDNSIASIACASKIEGTVSSHGEEAPAQVSMSSLSFTGCTNEWEVTTVTTGTLTFEEAGSSNATVRSTGATVIATRFGISCGYKTNNTNIGFLTGSYTTSSNATLHVEASIPRHSGSFLCGGSAVEWTGAYEVTTPSTVSVNDDAAKPKVVFGMNPAGTEFKVNETKEISVDADAFPEVWLLGKAELGVESGTWGLEDGANCLKKEVKKKEVVCIVKVKCAAKGNAEFRIFIAWAKSFGLLGVTLKCA